MEAPSFLTLFEQVSDGARKKDLRTMVAVGLSICTLAEMSLRQFDQIPSCQYTTRPRTRDDAMQLQLQIL